MFEVGVDLRLEVSLFAEDVLDALAIVNMLLAEGRQAFPVLLARGKGLAVDHPDFPLQQQHPHHLTH
jgi:hypothetical protein